MTTEDTTGAPAAGWWPSPWSSDQVSAGKVARSGLQADGGLVAWVESRPDEGGRQVVVVADPAAPDDGPVDRTPSEVSVRSRVHEYGGGAATLSAGVLFYVDQEDQCWYRIGRGADAAPVRLAGTDGPGARHTDGRTTADGQWLVSVEERVDGTSATHRLVASPADGAGPAVVLVDDGDFVAAPRPSPDGRWLAWCTWDHPDMPWDSTTLRLAQLTMIDGSPAIGTARDVAGGEGVSVGQPRWSADGALLFVDDRTGWWMPYRLAARGLDGDGPAVPVPLVDAPAEFHGPDWVFGQHTFDELADGSLVARMGSGGLDRLVVLRVPAAGPDEGGWAVETIPQPCVSLSGVVSPDGDRIVVSGTTATEAAGVFDVSPDGSRSPRRLCAPPRVQVSDDQVSHSEPRTADTPTHQVPGLFFPPTNSEVTPGTDPPPPLVVFCHGGPTAAAEPGYDPVVQFLTSRGIAVAAVDYRGSTGYGRDYRDLLRGGWGEADVDDCVAFARSLADAGLVDGARMAIRGTSAGGLTALAALIRSRAFAGAVAWYGVTDLEALAADTHDFESRYMDRLVGPLPEAADTYRDRSPLHHTAALKGQVLLLQGSDAPIVPLDQAERFAAELRNAGTGCELIVFPGESHGFRAASTIEAALDAELGFYRAIFAPDGADRD